MKLLVVLLFTVFVAADLNAQHKVFCEIIEQVVSQKKTRIFLDYGQERKKTKDIRVKKDDGEAEIFTSRVEALNIMSALGWKFEQVYVNVSGSSINGIGSTSSTTHYLLSKDVDSIKVLDNLIDEIRAKKLDLRTSE